VEKRNNTRKGGWQLVDQLIARLPDRQGKIGSRQAAQWIEYTSIAFSFSAYRREEEKLNALLL
jgi:hypothetical protein